MKNPLIRHHVKHAMHLKIYLLLCGICSMVSGNVSEKKINENICTAVIRADFRTHNLIGLELICGLANNVSESAASRVARQMLMDLNVSNVNNMDEFPDYHNNNVWIFLTKQEPGNIVVVSAHTGLVVFVGKLSHTKKEHIIYPKWRDPREIIDWHAEHAGNATQNGLLQFTWTGYNGIMRIHYCLDFFNPSFYKRFYKSVIRENDYNKQFDDMLGDFDDGDELVCRLMNSINATKLINTHTILDITIILYSGLIVKSPEHFVEWIILINFKSTSTSYSTSYSTNREIKSYHVLHPINNDTSMINETGHCTTIIRANYLTQRIKNYRYVCGSQITSMTHSDALERAKPILDDLCGSNKLYVENVGNIVNHSFFSCDGGQIIVSHYNGKVVFFAMYPSFRGDCGKNSTMHLDTVSFDSWNSSTKQLSMPGRFCYDPVLSDEPDGTCYVRRNSGLESIDMMLENIMNTSIIDPYDHIDEILITVYNPCDFMSDKHNEWIILISGRVSGNKTFSLHQYLMVSAIFLCPIMILYFCKNWTKKKITYGVNDKNHNASSE